MADVSFDTVNYIISVTTAPDANGEVSLDVQTDLYSEAKRQWLNTPDLRAHPLPVRVVGGDIITATQNLGATFFLLRNWRIKPYEADHVFNVIGNLYTDPEANKRFVPTDGAFTVQIINTVSNLVDSSVARLDLTQLLHSVYIDIANGTAGTEEGIGTPTNPVNNIADARVIADRDNLTSYDFKGTLTLDQDYAGWTFSGGGAIQSNTVDINGQNIDLSFFNNCNITGAMTGRITGENCLLSDVTNLDGIFQDTGISSTITLAENSIVVFFKCFSELASTSTPIVSVSAGANPVTSVSIRNYNGGITIKDLNHTDEVMNIDAPAGRIIIDSSCTDGTLVIGGVGDLTDNSAGTTVIKDAYLESEIVRTIRDILEGDQSIDSTDHIVYLKDTLTELVHKKVSGSNIQGTITLTEPP